MKATTQFPTPPWDMDTAAERLKFEEAAWNAHDPEQIAGGYADNIEMRDGLLFISGKEALKQFLREKLAKQLDFTLKLDLWGALKGRMAVRFEAEWHDASGVWFRSYGVQVFQFNEAGEAEKRFASQETLAIAAADRRLRPLRENNS
jgi:nuclear transport factor 2 (NTF2) superfamily protein